MTIFREFLPLYWIFQKTNFISISYFNTWAFNLDIILDISKKTNLISISYFNKVTWAFNLAKYEQNQFFDCGGIFRIFFECVVLENIHTPTTEGISRKPPLLLRISIF